MTPEEKAWEVELIQSRYEYLALTGEQAEKIYRFEQEKNTPSDNHFFSEWEEWDYELTAFREILNEAQLAKYEATRKEAMHRYEQSLIEQDAKETAETAYNKDLFHYYETTFLPPLLKDTLLRFDWLAAERNKINYLKAEYKRFLSESKKEILTSHFRHYKTFRPNALRIALRRHELSYSIPDYFFFRGKMDEPTKAVAAYLSKRLRYLPADSEALLTKQFDDLAAFCEANTKKHYGDLRDWHTDGQLSPEEEREHRVMTVLLMDENKYADY